MVKAKTKMDPPGVKRILDVGGPSSSKTNTPKTRNQKQTVSNYLKEKQVTTSTLLHKTPKHKLRTPRITVDEQSSLSSDSSSDELSSIWGQGPQIEEAEPQIRPPVPTSTTPRQSSPAVPQKLSVTAEVHCSQGGTKVNKDPTEAVPVAETDSVSAPAVPAPSDDEDFTVKISRKKQKRLLKSASVAISEEALNAILPATPPPQTPDKSHSPAASYLSAPREKIPPVIIHHHFEGDMTKINKEFHAKFQPLGFTTYRIKSGIACQTSTFGDYINLQKFLKENQVPFNLLRSTGAKPYKVVIKGIPSSTPPKVIQNELQAIGMSVQNVIPMTAWRDKSPLAMHIVELDNIPQSHKILQLNRLCYIKITVEPYKTRTVPPQCARCQQFYHVAASCQAPPACGYCAGRHCSWECEVRFEPNFVPTCALCKIGEHSTRFRGCPFFQELMEKESRLNRNKPSHSKPPPPRTHPEVLRARGLPKPPPVLNYNRHFPAMNAPNAWSRPLQFGIQTPTHNPCTTQPSNIPFNVHFQNRQTHTLQSSQDPRLGYKAGCACKGAPLISTHSAAGTDNSTDQRPPAGPPRHNRAHTPPPSTAVHGDTGDTNSQAPKAQRVIPAKPITQVSDNSTHDHRNSPSDLTEPVPQYSSAHSLTGPYTYSQGQRLGDLNTESQSRDFVNTIRSFNPAFSFQILIQSLSTMLLQFMQHPYESALPVIFNTFMSNILALNYGNLPQSTQ
jgi:hypothetical protein